MVTLVTHYGRRATSTTPLTRESYCHAGCGAARTQQPPLRPPLPPPSPPPPPKPPLPKSPPSIKPGHAMAGGYGRGREQARCRTRVGAPLLGRFLLVACRRPPARLPAGHPSSPTVSLAVLPREANAGAAHNRKNQEWPFAGFSDSLTRMYMMRAMRLGFEPRPCSSPRRGYYFGAMVGDGSHGCALSLVPLTKHAVLLLLLLRNVCRVV